MKYILNFLFLLLINVLYSQKTLDTIFVNQSKSSQMIFDDETVIDFVDIGTGDLSVAYRKFSNIVILQSIVAESSFINTNIFLKTKNNEVYNYIISYKENPKEYTYFVKNKNINTNAISQEKKVDNSDIKNILIENIINHKQKVFKPATFNISDTSCEFYAAYFINKKLYYKLKIINNSNLDYNVKDFYIYIKSIKSNKTAESERQIKPNKIFTNSNLIKGKKEEIFVIEFDQFSLNKEEELVIEIKEDFNGQRDYKLLLPHYITNRPIVL